MKLHKFYNLFFRYRKTDMNSNSPKFRVGNGYDIDDMEEDWFWDM